MSYANMADHQESTGNDLMPNGDYPFSLLEWEEKPTDSGLGLNMQFVITDGNMRNRRVFGFYNVQNANPTTVSISVGQVKAMVIACGFDGNQDLTAEVLNACIGVPFVGTVGVKKSKDAAHADKNEIKKFFSNQAYSEKLAKKGGATTVAPAAPAANAAPAPAPSQPAPVAPVGQPPAPAPAPQPAPAPPPQQAPAQQPAAAGTLPWVGQQAS